MKIGRAGTAGAVAASAGVLAALGCGGSNDQSATTSWANSVCSAVVTWQDDLKAVASDVKNSPSVQTLSTAATKAQESTQTLVTTLKGLDRPDGQDAQAAKDALDELSGQLQQDKATITGAIDSASGVNGVTQALAVVSGTLVTAKDQIAGTVATLKGLDVAGDMQKAFDDATACKQLTG